MRILHVCNYPAWIKVSEGKQPSHHLFGIQQQVEKYIKIRSGTRAILKNDEGYVDFLLWDDSKSMIDIVELYFKCFNYDIVYDTLCCVTKYLGILFRFYRPCKLVSIIHHPPFTKIMNYTRSDAYIFLDGKYMQMAINDNPKMKSRCFAVRWQPDKNWYEVQKTKWKGMIPIYDFIDNGKTARDHEMMTEAVYEIGAKTILINNIRLRPQAYKKDGCLTFIEQRSPDDILLLQQILKSKCILIPCKSNNNLMLGPVGSTSFMDAIALGKPVICSDNLYFARDIEKYSLGLVYKAGNKDSLISCMKKMITDEKLRVVCTDNMKRYAENKDIENYSKSVYKIITTVYYDYTK